ncbi:MAG TPA: glycosyltransferase family 2 protein [Puia sp.]|jgi:glycosyltransferase involved in cell wall biosynthesis|nr:glycosyltransferase family 2 protein [Puia sp.]
MQEQTTGKEIQISILVPVYNEQAVVPQLAERLAALMTSRQEVMEVIFINDGSTDNTSLQLFSICLSDSRFQCISFSRNFGHQIALTAGLHYARAKEAVFIIDGDLQDPPELFEVFYEKFQMGYEVVYGIRNLRKESGIKRFFYFGFYRIIGKLSTLHFPFDSGDFSLISRNVVTVMNQFPEESRFLRGIRSWVGFKQIGVAYERNARIAGSSKYSYFRLIRLAMNGIYNFSELPIRFISLAGFFSVLLALVYFVATLVSKFVYHTVPAGFTALLFAIILFSGVQLLSLGVIGEYVLRIFFQGKNRPLFIIDKKVFDKQISDGQ